MDIMSNEIHIDYASGNTVYFVIRNMVGQVWNPLIGSFEDWGTNGHNADDYDIALTDKGGARYVGSFDDNITAGRYSIQTFLQAGATPENGDTLIGARIIRWHGSGELTADKILTNKAMQNKSTGAIDYYDDDGQTILLTITPTEDESSITRIPS
jgi:hypothetical protein